MQSPRNRRLDSVVRLSRFWLGILLLSLTVGVPACRPVSSVSNPESRGSDAIDEDAIYERLTRVVWNNDAPGMFGHLESLRLSRDGRYHWHRESDVVERDDSGRWNFTAVTKQTGVLRLENTGDLPFRFADDALLVGNTRFAVENAEKPEPPEASLTRGQLSHLAPSAIAERLTGTWIKANPFDNYRLPTTIELHRDGSLKYEYRDGECRHHGVWGVYAGDRPAMTGTQFVNLVDDNDCDLRGSSAAISGQEVRFVDDHLWLGGVYRKATVTNAAPMLLFDAYSASLTTRADFSGSLEPGKEIDVTWTLSSANGQVFRLKSIRAGFEPLQFEAPTFSSTGDVDWQWEHAPASVQISPDRPYTFQQSLTVPETGWWSLNLDVVSVSPSQDWRGRGSFLVHFDDDAADSNR